MHWTTRLQRACSLISTPHSASTGLSPTSQTRSHVWPGTQISASAWARRDPSSASLINLWARQSSIRTSRSSRCVGTTYLIKLFFLESFLIPSTRPQKCFAGSSNSSNSTSSSSLASSQSATATNSTSQTSAASTTASATNSPSQPSAASATASDSTSPTHAGTTTATATGAESTA